MSETKTAILKLTVADIESVDALMKRNSRTLGFLPLEALKGYLEKGDVVGIKSSTGELLAYLLFATHRDYFRVTQLCVSDEVRGKGFARRLVEYLKESATTQKVIRLTCRNDFPAHSMWEKLGFVSIAEKSGRSKEGHLLTIWHLIVAPDDQLALFRAEISDTVLDVAMDAQIFFHFDEPVSEVTQASKVLLSDTFVDSVNLGFTDELFNEISRNPDADKRRADRERTAQFFQVKYDPLTVNVFSQKLKQILPTRTSSQRSDINHLAKTAASNVKVFVTSDQRLLKKSRHIESEINVQVLSPTQLILRLNELSDGERNRADRVSGLGLQWRHLTSDELAEFPFQHFLNGDEPLRGLRRKTESLLVEPIRHEVEVLWSGDAPIALRGISYESERTLAITLGRVAKSRSRASIGQFLISDSVYKAVRQGREMVKFKESDVSAHLLQGLTEMGFVRRRNEFIRFCFAHHLDRVKALSEIAEMDPEAVDLYRGLSDNELERSCSPLTTGANLNYFLMPIQPRHAINLIDREQSARDMFGGNPDVLLLWHNVYYRTAVNHRNTLRAPGRILWYVSGNRGAIVAVSHLDGVEVATPRVLFRRFERAGTLGWKDLYEMSGRETLRELMAIQFSHTFPFAKPIALDDVRKAFKEDRAGFTVQSPSRLHPSTFRNLFELGYPERS